MFRKSWLAFIILLQLTAAEVALASERPVVQEVITTQEGNGARIEIRADLPLVYKSYLMPELAKWVIDLPEAKTIYCEDESKRMRTAPLERITVRQKEVNGDLFTRIGLDFKGEVDFSIKADPLDKRRVVALMSPAKATRQKLPGDTPVPVAPQSYPKKQTDSTGSAKSSVTPSATGMAAKTVALVRITADSIRIEADGRLSMPTPLILTKPGRLVLDLADVTSGVGKVPVPAANRFGIVRSRLGKNGDKLRIVFEVSGDTFPDFQLKEVFNGAEVVLAAKETLK